MHHYTPEELLLYLYNELSAEQAAAINEELRTNWSLCEKLAVMKTAMERLNSIVEAPRTEVVLNVLRYAREAASVATPTQS